MADDTNQPSLHLDRALNALTAGLGSISEATFALAHRIIQEREGEDEMSKKALLCGSVLIASFAVAAAAQAQAQGSNIPNFSSAEFGWQPASGLDFLPVEGKVAPCGPQPRRPAG